MARAEPEEANFQNLLQRRLGVDSTRTISFLNDGNGEFVTIRPNDQPL